jgi:flagellin-like protein
MQGNYGKPQNRWRRKGKRGVSPIIATILLVAITVVLAAVLYILISGLTKGPGNTPLGTALALGKPLVSANGTGFIYHFQIQSAGGGLLYSNLNFQVQTGTGAIVALAGGHINVLNLGGVSVANYNPGTGAWLYGSTVAVTSSQQVALDFTASLSGDTLVVSGTGSFQGSISVAIP